MSKLIGGLIFLFGVAVAVYTTYYSIWHLVILSVVDLINQCKAKVTDPYAVGIDLVCLCVLWEFVLGFGLFVGGIIGSFGLSIAFTTPKQRRYERNLAELKRNLNRLGR